MNIRTKKYMGALAVLIIVAGAGIAGTASAATAAPATGATAAQHGRGMGMMGARKPGVSGKVTAVSGDTITVTARQFAMRPRGATATSTPTTAPAAPATVTYTIDATNATVTKAGAASTVSAIAVGDTVMVQGTVSGTSVAATSIMDGFAKGTGMGTGMMGGMGGATGAGLSALPAGNGQPIVGGKIAAVSGTSITVTNTAGVTYNVDASAAKFSKPGATSATIANMSVGDSVIVQGTVNGTSVTAATVIDQGAAPTTTTTSANGTTTTKPATKGFLGSIGGFFAHLFGF